MQRWIQVSDFKCLHCAVKVLCNALQEKVERLLAELDSDMQELPDQTALGEAGMQLQVVASTARERLAWLPAVKSNSTSPRYVFMQIRSNHMSSSRIMLISQKPANGWAD